MDQQGEENTSMYSFNLYRDIIGTCLYDVQETAQFVYQWIMSSSTSGSFILVKPHKKRPPPLYEAAG